MCVEMANVIHSIKSVGEAAINSQVEGAGDAPDPEDPRGVVGRSRDGGRVGVWCRDAPDVVSNMSNKLFGTDTENA